MLKENVQFIGLGMCGNRLGRLLESVGYDVLYFNSDLVDVRGLGVKEENLLLISGTGTGGSPIKGKEIIDVYIEEFTRFFTDKMMEGKMQIFLAGLGGGTGGSSLIPAIKIAKDLGHKVGVIATLPPKMLGMLASDNALKTLRTLKELDLNMFLIADNEYLTQEVGLSDNWWLKINEYIITKVVSVFSLLREGKITQSGLGSIDKAEIMRILQHGGGQTDIREVIIKIKELDSMDEEKLKEVLFKPCLVEGYNYKDTQAYMVSIDVPVKGVYTNFSSKVFDITKNVSGSAISRLGMFVDPLLTDSVRVTLINAGLKLPKVLKSRMNNLKRDAERYKDKRSKGDSMDFDGIDSLALDDDFDI